MTNYHFIHFTCKTTNIFYRGSQMAVKLVLLVKTQVVEQTLTLYFVHFFSRKPLHCTNKNQSKQFSNHEHYLIIMITKKKLFLTLEQGVAAIKLLEQGKSAQSIATQFGCGRTQIQVCKI